MGILGGGNSTTNQTTVNDTTNQDNRVAVTGDNGAISLDLAGGTSGNITLITNDPSVGTRMVAAGSGALDSAAGAISVTAGALGQISMDSADTFQKISGDTTGLLRTISGDSRAGGQAVLDATSRLGDQMIQAQRIAADNARDLANGYMNAAGRAQDASYNFSRSTLDNTLNFGRDTLHASQNQSDTALAAIRQTSSTLLDFINTNIKPADQQAFQATIPWLIGGAVALAFVYGMRK